MAFCGVLRGSARAGLPVVVVLGFVGGCAPASTAPPSPAEALCAQLDSGANATSLAAADPASTTDPVGVLTRAQDAIRVHCPQHEQQAALLERVAAQVGQPSSADPAADEGPDPASDVPSAQAPRRLRYRVEGDGIKQAAVTWTAGGSSGGDTGTPVALPWTRVNGHRFLPDGGHEFSPLAASRAPHGRPAVLPSRSVG